MKKLILFPLLIAAPAFAGTSAKQVVTQAPDPCVTAWFGGASVGYLTQLETPLYTANIGVTNSCWNIAGWNIALYGEVGYAEKDDVDSDSSTSTKLINDATVVTNVKSDADVTIVPITLNVKFEHQITGNLGAYFGGGLGMAWVDADWSSKTTTSSTTYVGSTPVGPTLTTVKHQSQSDSDWVFCAQVFAGLTYHVSPQCEIYGGGRWIHLADPTLFGSSQSLNDDWLVELGARYKF